MSPPDEHTPGGSGPATDATPWDGNAAMTAATSAADYRAICAGEHTVGEPDERTHWALPHHKRPGAPANAEAIRNARARFNQVQQLTDREAVRRHIFEIHQLPAERDPAPMGGVLHRTLAVRLEAAGEGRTVFGLCVPYEVPTVVDDGYGPYREVFAAGAFARATKAPDRVEFKYRHQPSVTDLLGRATTLEERSEGLWGAFGVVKSSVGDHALELVREGMLRSLSVGFEPVSPARRLADGTVVRTKCALTEVSLCPEGAYAGALVGGVRERLAAERRHVLEPDPDAERRNERLRALGY